MNHILVIGGTGNVGRHVVDQLGAAGARFRVMTRNPDAACLPSQADVVRGDLTVPETLDRCLEGIETCFWYGSRRRRLRRARWNESRRTRGESCFSLLRSMPSK